MAARGVNLGYHIKVHDFLYSVPHALISAKVDVRITARTLEIFDRGQRVRAHRRRYMGRKHGSDPTTCPAPTDTTQSGRRIGFAAGSARSGRASKD
jgi:hypothetical protein